MIPHNKPTLGVEEEAAALRVIKSGWLARGKEVSAFEDELCDFLELPKGGAVAVSSGTAALYLALWALLPSGGSVGIPAYACASLRHAVAFAGAEERLLDSTLESPNLNLHSLEGTGVSAVIAPHTYGIPLDLSLPSKVPIVEDCAQALGARWQGKPVGRAGAISIFSFAATKLITSGGAGGMIVSRDSSLIEAIRDYLDFDGRADGKIRFNFQLTDLQAAVGREQLRRLPSFLARRRELFELYESRGLSLLKSVNPDMEVAPFRAIVRTRDPKRFCEHMKNHEIKCINPFETEELLGPAAQFPFAASWTHCTASLPLYPSLTNEIVAHIADIAQAYLAGEAG